MAEPRADLIEVFSSYQGEGLFLGAKQIFIRFADCNLNCTFCDTPKDAVKKDLSVDEVLEEVMRIEAASGIHHSFSITGGEPLLHADFLEQLLPRLKNERSKIYLETNGTLPEELRRIIAYVDIIAMDIKLPSSTNMRPLWKKHIEFLEIAGKKRVFIKVVVTGDTVKEDILKARDIVESFDKGMLFILQPASPTENGDFTAKREKIFNYYELSGERLKNVRIVPQVHKFLGIK